MIDLNPFLDAVRGIVSRCRCGRAGAYSRSPGRSEPDAYGTADAANLLYTLGAFPSWQEHEVWIAALQSFQDKESGLCLDDTHHPLHTTAHVTAALELFGATPAYPLTGLRRYRDGGELEKFLEELDWSWNPWGESHKGAGIYAALVLAGDVDAAWQDRYFAWLHREADPVTGFWRRGHVATGGEQMLFHHLAGSFHYLFNHEYACRPLPYPEAMVESCLRLWHDRLFAPLGRTVGYAELDWVYCLNRSTRQSGARHAEVQAALERFACDYTSFLFSLAPGTDPGLDDLHQLLGAVSALAELQQAVPGLLRSTVPLRLVLDRRPFI